MKSWRGKAMTFCGFIARQGLQRWIWWLWNRLISLMVVASSSISKAKIGCAFYQSCISCGKYQVGSIRPCAPASCSMTPICIGNPTVTSSMTSWFTMPPGTIIMYPLPPSHWMVGMCIREQRPCSGRTKAGFHF